MSEEIWRARRRMLAKVEAQRLVSQAHVAKVLGMGSVLPLNNNQCLLDVDGMSTVSVVEEDAKSGEQRQIAFGLFHRCTKNQMYCSVVVTSPDYAHNYVNVEQVKTKNAQFGLSDSNPSQYLLKITEAMAQLPDLSGLPQYYSAFAEPPARPLVQCVVDELVERNMGHFNFEMSRNLTVDLYDASNGVDAATDCIWRDFSGFIVTDRSRYSHLTIKSVDLLDVVRKGLGANTAASERLTTDGVPYHVEPLSKANWNACVDFDDAVVIAQNRQAYLEYLFSLHNASGAVALTDGGECMGYVLTLDGHVLQCYAEEPSIANHLFVDHMESILAKTPEISMFVRLSGGGASTDEWCVDALVARAVETHRVRRFHTRVVPMNIKWSKVYTLNMGVHIF